LRYGKEELKKILGDLKLIYVTHYHLDHHLGISDIVYQRRNLGIKEDIFLILPRNLKKYYEDLLND
jgi:ribonuclease BN (tRNA processing enzyme)